MPAFFHLLKRYLPILDWGAAYNRSLLIDDAFAALIVTIMLIPQSLAYALLAGLPAQIGLYASILPLLGYALFGTSSTLAVGPVAVASLMTAAALSNLGTQDPATLVAAAAGMALFSGLFLMLMGFFRLGFLANFLSHPVIAGFITASAILIAVSQFKHLLGISASGDNLLHILHSLYEHSKDISWLTFILSLPTLFFLFWTRKNLKPLLLAMHLPEGLANLLAKAGPIVAIIATSWLSFAFDLERHGIAIVGEIPAGLPQLSLPYFSKQDLSLLGSSIILISLVGFVESVSVAQTLAAKRRERITPDQELIGLGAANMAAGISGGYPVTGGFARSVVNFDAGARTPAAGLFTALGIALVAAYLTPYLYYLPTATLAATIIAAVLSLVDFSILKSTWRLSKSDFLAVLATLGLTLLINVEWGISAGLLISIALHLYRTSKPHVALVGQVGDSQHFRNVLRHQVKTDPHILALRIDESLYFANARFLENFIYDQVVKQPQTKHVVLLCSAVNALDSSALESLKAINHHLDELGVKFHLSEVKGPVMDRIRRSDLLNSLTGDIALSHYEMIKALRQDNS